MISRSASNHNHPPFLSWQGCFIPTWCVKHCEQSMGLPRTRKWQCGHVTHRNNNPAISMDGWRLCGARSQMAPVAAQGFVTLSRDQYKAEFHETALEPGGESGNRPPFFHTHQTPSTNTSTIATVDRGGKAVFENRQSR